MKKIQLLFVLSSIVLAGCTTGTRIITLNPPEFSIEKSSSGEIYIASIEDKRVFEQKPRDPSTPSVKGDLSSIPQDKLSTLIGRQRNSFGAAMGDLALPQGSTVQSEIRKLVTKGLESRGYSVVDDINASNKITIDIDKFWAWFTPGMFAVSFESNLQCKIDFKNATEEESFAVTGYGINKGQVASNANWELAFDRAFRNFLENMDKIFDEKEL
jgi:uncharacterized lipoprotein YajG